jgi:hypothetical protein
VRIYQYIDKCKAIQKKFVDHRKNHADRKEIILELLKKNIGTLQAKYFKAKNNKMIKQINALKEGGTVYNEY